MVRLHHSRNYLLVTAITKKIKLTHPLYYITRIKAMFCFVFVLFCFVLFCFVLFCFVLLFSVLFFNLLFVVFTSGKSLAANGCIIIYHTSNFGLHIQTRLYNFGLHIQTLYNFGLHIQTLYNFGLHNIQTLYS